MLAHAQSVETSSASANKQVDALRRELSLIKQELEKELQTNKQLSHSKADLEAECTSLRNNLANLEREGRDKAAGEKRLEELLQMANEQKVCPNLCTYWKMHFNLMQTGCSGEGRRNARGLQKPKHPFGRGIETSYRRD